MESKEFEKLFYDTILQVLTFELFELIDIAKFIL